jgi:hypothetical protein
MGSIFVFALLAAVDPSLLAVVFVLLTLPNTDRLLFAYFVGAVLVSVTAGFLLVFAFHGSGAANTEKHAVRPVIDIALGAIILGVTVRVATRTDRLVVEWSTRRHAKDKDKPPPRWRQALLTPTWKKAFVLGLVMTLPGAEYIAGMLLLRKQHVGLGGKIGVILAFNVIMLLLVIVPLIGFAVKPDATNRAVKAFNDWLHRDGRNIALIAAAAIGIYLVIRGAVNLG